MIMSNNFDALVDEVVGGAFCRRGLFLYGVKDLPSDEALEHAGVAASLLFAYLHRRPHLQNWPAKM